MKRTAAVAAVVVLALAVAAAVLAALAWRERRAEAPVGDTAPPATVDAQAVRRGAELARAGNCAGCHTSRGGAPYAGGRGIDTPFGTVYASNLTPDGATGLGRWNADHFWRALHHGRSRDGRLLYPAFPYPEYTRVTRADADALYAFLRSLPPVAQPNRRHDLRFPYDSQAALAVWRALYFRPGVHVDDPARSAEWNRGAYLVRGLGHCNACHGTRNWLGATSGSLELSGGLIPMQNWYAPALADAREAGVARWPTEEVVRLLKTGVTDRASVLGPMAEVVFRSTQYLAPQDLRAVAVFLQALPPADPRPGVGERVRAWLNPRPDADPALSGRGARLYEQHCAKCHGDRGEGVPGAYLPLAGNRAVTLPSPANLIRVVLGGGFAPATAGNPRPHGMPPFAHVLDDTEVAAVLTYLRGAWGHDAPPVAPNEVLRLRR